MLDSFAKATAGDWSRKVSLEGLRQDRASTERMRRSGEQGWRGYGERRGAFNLESRNPFPAGAHSGASGGQQSAGHSMHSARHSAGQSMHSTGHSAGHSVHSAGQRMQQQHSWGTPEAVAPTLPVSGWGQYLAESTATISKPNGNASYTP